MNQKQFLKRLAEVKAEAVEISRRKNADYASDGDPFQNFRLIEYLTASRACPHCGKPDPITAEDGLIVRLSDKLQRGANVLTRKAKVKDERVVDTLRDLSNYSDILSILIESRPPRR